MALGESPQADVAQAEDEALQQPWRMGNEPRRVETQGSQERIERRKRQDVGVAANALKSLPREDAFAKGEAVGDLWPLPVLIGVVIGQHEERVTDAKADGEEREQRRRPRITTVATAAAIG